MEDINFCKTALCLNDLNNIFFATKALDFSGATTKTGWMPPPLCWKCESQPVSFSSTIQLLHQGKGNVEFLLFMFCGHYLERLAIEGIWREQTFPYMHEDS